MKEHEGNKVTFEINEMKSLGEQMYLHSKEKKSRE